MGEVSSYGHSLLGGRWAAGVLTGVGGGGIAGGQSLRNLEVGACVVNDDDIARCLHNVSLTMYSVVADKVHSSTPGKR